MLQNSEISRKFCNVSKEVETVKALIISLILFSLACASPPTKGGLTDLEEQLIGQWSAHLGYTWTETPVDKKGNILYITHDAVCNVDLKIWPDFRWERTWVYENPSSSWAEVGWWTVRDSKSSVVQFHIDYVAPRLQRYTGMSFFYAVSFEESESFKRRMILDSPSASYVWIYVGPVEDHSPWTRVVPKRGG